MQFDKFRNSSTFSRKSNLLEDGVATKVCTPEKFNKDPYGSPPLGHCGWRPGKKFSITEAPIRIQREDEKRTSNKKVASFCHHFSTDIV